MQDSKCFCKSLQKEKILTRINTILENTANCMTNIKSKDTHKELTLKLKEKKNLILSTSYFSKTMKIPLWESILGMEKLHLKLDFF